MKLKQLKIGHRIYKVIFVDGRLSNELAVGECDLDKTAISIKRKGLSHEAKRDTIIHEAMHAMFYEAGFEDDDEDTVNRLAKVLDGFLADNEKAIKEMYKDRWK